MAISGKTFVGVDVGCQKKGFHAVLLRDNDFVLIPRAFLHPTELVDWCLSSSGEVVAVDAPCGWSQTGKSRAAERELRIAGRKVHCFATPTRILAEAHQKSFYDWVFNGERLYEALLRDYPIFDGLLANRRTAIETFPHAIVCALACGVVSAKPKTLRRKIFRDRGYDDSQLRNIDFVDAALCALTAKAFSQGQVDWFGSRDEGIIVVPRAQFRS